MKKFIIINKSKKIIGIFDNENPIKEALVISNDKFSKFRAYKGENNLDPNHKKYVAVLYEIEEEINE